MKREDISKSSFLNLKLNTRTDDLKVELYRRPVHMLNQDGIDAPQNFYFQPNRVETFVRRHVHSAVTRDMLWC